MLRLKASNGSQMPWLLEGDDLIGLPEAQLAA